MYKYIYINEIILCCILVQAKDHMFTNHAHKLLRQYAAWSFSSSSNKFLGLAQKLLDDVWALFVCFCDIWSCPANKWPIVLVPDFPPLRVAAPVPPFQSQFFYVLRWLGNSPFQSLVVGCHPWSGRKLARKSFYRLQGSKWRVPVNDALDLLQWCSKAEVSMCTYILIYDHICT